MLLPNAYDVAIKALLHINGVRSVYYTVKVCNKLKLLHLSFSRTTELKNNLELILKKLTHSKKASKAV